MDIVEECIFNFHRVRMLFLRFARTAMHAGAYNDQIECMELLEQRDGDVNAVDIDGYTPLMIAGERGHDRAIGMLFNHINIKLSMNYAS